MKRFVIAALLLVLWPLLASAQVRIGAAAEATGAPVVGPVIGNPASMSLPKTSVSLLSSSVLLSVAPAPTLINTANAVMLSNAVVLPVQALAVAPSAAGAKPVALGLPVAKIPLVVAGKSAVALTRSQRAAIIVRDEVSDWTAARRLDDTISGTLAQERSALAPFRSAAAADSPVGVPAPPAKAPNSLRPRLSKALLISGTILVGASLAAVVVPALVPASVVAWKGVLAWSGLASLAASRFWRVPGSAPDVPRGPPAPAGGAFSSFKAAWAAARDSAAAQSSFETRVGGASWSAFRDWLLGGLRTGLYWMAPSLLLMLGGAALFKGGALIVGAATAKVATVASAAATVANPIPMALVMGSVLPLALTAQAAGVALYFIVESLARRLGAGRAAPWLGGAAALALAGGALLTLTHAPFVIAVSLALEAGVIWSAARSRSFLAPLALRAILTLFSIEAARLSLWISLGTASVLVGLPAVWGGLTVGALALLAWRLKSPSLRLADIGSWWNAAEPGQRPKSPGRILSAGLVWGLVVYAVGDLVFWGVNAIVPGHEPAPAILAKMLTSGVDLVLYNFILVGLLEEYVFRRGLFKMMNDKLDQWGLSLGKAFWIAAIGSALIFSGVHYIDWGSVLAKLGMGDPAAASGLGGAYDFTWAGFMARSVLGVLLAWMYKRSGLLLIPIVAHFWADSMEGLGLRWGFPAFLALAVGALVVSFLVRPKALKPKSS